jgi:hypothetical protein
VVGCTAIDRAAGNWKVTVKYSLVGGSYKKFQWSGLDDNSAGITYVTVRGLPVSALKNVLPVMSDGAAQFYAMNGLSGVIDYVYFNDQVDVALSNYCS